ncbi:uncharacterized protein WM294_007370 isoform 2-T2 [Sarcoramphus papa]
MTCCNPGPASSRRSAPRGAADVIKTEDADHQEQFPRRLPLCGLNLQQVHISSFPVKSAGRKTTFLLRHFSCHLLRDLLFLGRNFHCRKKGITKGNQQGPPAKKCKLTCSMQVQEVSHLMWDISSGHSNSFIAGSQSVTSRGCDPWTFQVQWKT